MFINFDVFIFDFFSEHLLEIRAFLLKFIIFHSGVPSNVLYFLVEQLLIFQLQILHLERVFSLYFNNLALMIEVFILQSSLPFFFDLFHILLHACYYLFKVSFHSDLDFPFLFNFILHDIVLRLILRQLVFIALQFVLELGLGFVYQLLLLLLQVLSEVIELVQELLLLFLGLLRLLIQLLVLLQYPLYLQLVLEILRLHLL